MEAVRRSVVDVAYLEVAVVASFSSDAEASDVDTGEVVFVSPAGGDGDGDTNGRGRVALRLGADGLSPQRQEAAAALAELLDRLTEGVDVAR